jgi:hypothetical protein
MCMDFTFIALTFLTFLIKHTAKWQFRTTEVRYKKISPCLCSKQGLIFGF